MWQVVVSICVCVLGSLIAVLWSCLSLILSLRLCQSAMGRYIGALVNCSSFSFVWPVSSEVCSLSLLPLSLSVWVNSSLSFISSKLPPLPLSSLPFLNPSIFPPLLSPPVNSVSATTVRVPDAGIYMVGLAVFTSHNPLHRAPAASLSAPQPPSRGIEVGRNLGLFTLVLLKHTSVKLVICVLNFPQFFPPLRRCCSHLWALFKQVVCPPLSLSLRNSAHKSTFDSRPTGLTVIIPACTCCSPVSGTQRKHTFTQMVGIKIFAHGQYQQVLKETYRPPAPTPPVRQNIPTREQWPTLSKVVRRVNTRHEFER